MSTRIRALIPFRISPSVRLDYLERQGRIWRGTNLSVSYNGWIRFPSFGLCFAPRLELSGSARSRSQLAERLQSLCNQYFTHPRQRKIPGNGFAGTRNGTDRFYHWAGPDHDRVKPMLDLVRIKGNLRGTP